MEIKNKINYGRQFLNQLDLIEVSKSLKNDKISQGPYVDKFENAIKKKIGSRYAYACNSGTSALHLAFISAGLKKNDIIILPSINFIAASNISEMMSLKYYFADIDYRTGQITPETVMRCIKENKLKKIKAILLMFMGGYPRNIKKFFQLKKKLKCYLIEDACHAFGASYMVNKKKYNIGSCQHSDISTFSFHPLKSITTGEGGAVTTNNESIAKKIRLFRSHGFEENMKNRWDYKSKSFGLNYRLSDINAALGYSQINKLKKFLKKRKDIYRYYLNHLDKYKNLINIVKEENKTSPSYHLIIAGINFIRLKINKVQFLKQLEKKKILCQFHYIPCYNFGKYHLKNNKKLINSELYKKEVFSLPIYYNINKSELNYITKTIKEIINLWKIK